MALAHNLLLRMLNTVYLQCEYVHQRKDVMDFLLYCRCWSRTLHHHHSSEETLFFPKIEAEVIGKPGSMQQNLDQHDEFQRGLEEFAEWVEKCEKEGGEGYDGKKAKAMIDRFGPSLEKHMHEEIDTLLALREYDPDGEKGKRFFLEMEAEVQKGLDPKLDIPWCLGNQDLTYEGGTRNLLPWVPTILGKWWFYRKHRGAWRFCACDFNGKPRRLQFLP